MLGKKWDLSLMILILLLFVPPSFTPAYPKVAEVVIFLIKSYTRDTRTNDWNEIGKLKSLYCSSFICLDHWTT